MAQVTSPAQRATIQSLAPETLIAIFEHFQENRHSLHIDEDERVGSVGHGDLCKFALVCRAWRNPAQLVLFETVHLRSISGVTNLETLADGYMDCWRWDVWYTGICDASTIASTIPSNARTLVLSISFAKSSANPFFDTMLEVLKQPELANIHRLEFLSISKAQFMGASGLDLLEECEERSIVVYGKNEYL
ncbi:hypothetical protein RQP46_007466 [Phenoliferia psychrophenolica]